MSRILTHPAHGDGPTFLSFLPDGLSVLTGGQDCVVRRWKTVFGQEQEPDLAHEADDAISSIAVSENNWFSASEDTELRRYPRDSMNMDGVITSTSGVPMRCVAVDPQGKILAVTSDELTVKLIDCSDITNVTLLEGHTRGVRKATWHPSEPILITCGSDGDIIVWDTSSETQPSMVKKIDGILPMEIDAKSAGFSHDCSALWHPSGDYFFIATRSREIITISREKWSKDKTFEDSEVSGEPTALAVSPNGVYLATSSNGKVHVWSIQSRLCLFSYPLQTSCVVNAIAFCPTQNLLAWTDSTGSLNFLPKPIKDGHPDPVKSSTSDKAAVPEVESFFNDDMLHGDDIDLEAGDAEDDWIIDDIGGGMQDGTDKVTSNSKYVKEMVSITKAQPPFQPGSTPMRNKKKYLAYNTLGVIEITDQDVHHIVNVEFFDRSSRIGYHFTDNHKYDLGYLGDCGALFACKPDGGHAAQLLYKPHSRWNSQSEWTYSLQRADIQVLGIAAGGVPSPLVSQGTTSDDDLNGLGNVVVATSEGDLTFLSGTGRERRIVGLGADFVTMAASHEYVFVVHRAGSTTIDGSQKLTYSLINFEDFTVRQRDVLPIRKGHTLKWVGITDEGAPVIYDSTGCIHMLTKYRIPHHASWARIMDTNLLERRQGKDESYWPVGLSSSTFLCLILKGKQEYPGFPRPLIQELPVNLPFRRGDAAEEKLERELLFLEVDRDALGEELTTSDLTKREVAIDKELIQLMQQACKTTNVPRALELAKLLHHDKTLEAAIKLAGFYNLVGLTEKLEALKSNREDVEDRMIAAREKRMSWNQLDRPQKRMQELPISSSVGRPFQDYGPPPPKHRPGLAPAVPQVDMRFSSVAPSSTFETDTPSPSSTPIANGKRKRDDAVDSPFDSDSNSRKRPSNQPEFAALPPKTKANPFARKPVQDTGVNPFGRKQDTTNGTLKKTDSFFDKIDAAELNGKASKQKTKPKDKKDGPKQTTLFGMKGITKDRLDQNKDKQPTISSPVINDQTVAIAESLENSKTAEDSQMEDDVPNPARAESPEWELEAPPCTETQVAEETQLMECKF